MGLLGRFVLYCFNCKWTAVFTLVTKPQHARAWKPAPFWYVRFPVYPRASRLRRNYAEKNIIVIGYMTDAEEGAVIINKGGNRHKLVAQGWQHA
jgi:hypothetical protein